MVEKPISVPETNIIEEILEEEAKLKKEEFIEVDLEKESTGSDFCDPSLMDMNFWHYKKFN